MEEERSEGEISAPATPQDRAKTISRSSTRSPGTWTSPRKLTKMTASEIWAKILVLRELDSTPAIESEITKLLKAYSKRSKEEKAQAAKETTETRERTSTSTVKATISQTRKAASTTQTKTHEAKVTLLLQHVGEEMAINLRGSFLISDA